MTALRQLDHVHGAVNNRCAHPDCQAAFARWSKQYDLDRHRGIDRTLDADIARRHIAALEAAGWSRRSIAAQAGISSSAVSRMVRGQRTVKRTVLDKLLAVQPTSYATTPHRTSREVFVPRVGTVRRVQALLAIGWTHQLIGEHSGVNTRVLLTQQGRWVARSTHDKVATAYRALAMRQGPSAVTRRRAARLGYLTPAVWDDIDIDREPEADDTSADTGAIDEVVVQRVLAGEHLPCTTAERREVVRRWHTTGRSLNDLARLTGWKPERYSA